MTLENLFDMSRPDLVRYVMDGKRNLGNGAGPAGVT
jgi:hypothetical protein